MLSRFPEVVVFALPGVRNAVREVSFLQVTSAHAQSRLLWWAQNHYWKTSTTLQIRCGDLYADKAVEAFTACAVSDKKCVPQRVDESTFPQPPPTALDAKFDLNNFQVIFLSSAGVRQLSGLRLMISKAPLLHALRYKRLGCQTGVLVPSRTRLHVICL